MRRCSHSGQRRWLHDFISRCHWICHCVTVRTVWLPLASPGVAAVAAVAAISITVAVVALPVAALVARVVARRSSNGTTGGGKDG
jgi:hypothetical protein